MKVLEEIDEIDDDEEIIEEAHVEREPKRKIGRPKKKQDKPPKESQSAPKKRGRPPGSVKKHNYKAEIKADLEELFGFWQLSDPICGTVALERSDKIAGAADRYLQKSERAQQFLEFADKKSGPLGLILAVFPIVTVAWMHHVRGIGPMSDEQETQEQYVDLNQQGDMNGAPNEYAQAFVGR